MNKREVAEALADKAWWEELEIVPGWTLYGWTFRDRASFRTGKTTTIQITFVERNQILAAIQGAGEELPSA